MPAQELHEVAVLRHEDCASPSRGLEDLGILRFEQSVVAHVARLHFEVA